MPQQTPDKNEPYLLAYPSIPLHFADRVDRIGHAVKKPEGRINED